MTDQVPHDRLRASPGRSNSPERFPSASVSTLQPSIANPSPKSSEKPPEGQAQQIFQCDQCPKVFNRRENLNRHVKTHNAVPSHHCSRCGKGFTRSDLLNRHEAGHQRWDQQDINGQSSGSKRRKLPFRASETQAPPRHNLSWTPASEGHSTYGQQLPISGQYAMVQESSMQGEQLHANYTPDHQMPPGGLSHLPESGMPQYHTDKMDTTFVPFDFSTFLLPPDVNHLGVNQMGSEWFSFDFYSAMREVGNDAWGSSEGIDTGIVPSDGHGPMMGNSVEKLAEHYEFQHDHRSQHYSQPPAENEASFSSYAEEGQLEDPANITRVSSPPNEASEEDKWPFQWNPNSRQILEALPIELPDDHYYFRSHDTRYDISELTLMKMRSFLALSQRREHHQSQKGVFTLPPLPILNVFIRLFFYHFSPQMPVLHHATVNTNVDLPPPLLATMVVIGAVYSHLKHTRRFAIVLLDVVRWHLQIAIQYDNSLMRNPMIIYAQALICHTGLWIGNKRAFELAEVVRGALVTYIRRLRFGEELKTHHEDKKKMNIQDEWRHWVQEEQQRRLAWIVYTIDCQFPSILNLPPTISLGEVRSLGCPCDEEFWLATSARNWKNLLGPASVPPSRSFSAAIGPFLLLTTLPPPTDGLTRDNSFPRRLPILNLNPWSVFIVLMTIQHEVFQFHQESLITRSFIDDEGSDPNANSDEENASIEEFQNLRSIRRNQLAEALSTFSSSYLSHPHPQTANRYTSSAHFNAASLILHHLSTILLDVPLSDLQSALGKDGVSGITQSIDKLTLWARMTPSISQNVTLNAICTIVFLAPTNNLEPDTAPYSIITLFLCHVVLYVFAQVSSREQRLELLELVEKRSDLKLSSFVGVLRKGFGVGEDERDLLSQPKTFLKSGAEMLIRVGTWGGALNLALLMLKRSEM